MCGPCSRGVLMVIICDITIGFATLFVSGISLYYFRYGIDRTHKKGYSSNVAWFGIISIPLLAILGTCGGVIRLINFYRKGGSKSKYSPHYWRFWVFFAFEILEFALPFLVFEMYMQKVQTMYEDHSLSIYRLLEVNPVTIGLFVYQIISFLIVHRYHALLTRRNRVQNPRTPSERKDEEMQMIPAVNKSVCHNKLGSDIKAKESTGNNQYPKLDENQDTDQNSSKVFYPDLASMMDEMATLPTYSNVNVNFGGKGEIQFGQFHKNDLFEDADFPPTARSLGSGRTSEIQWLRPGEINESARFFTDGFDRFDVKQGELGDCWFIASVANLTLNKRYFDHVVPKDNEWADGGTYNGMCRFRFYKDGNWTEVTIDDRLPTKGGKLMFMRSSDPTEFWSALLEKAYAKFHGSYASLDGRDGMYEGMMNLTGGDVQRYRLQEYMQNQKSLFGKMSKALEENNMIGICASAGDEQQGIFGGHAYSVTHVSTITFQSGKDICCVRIRNPWGTGKEWTGQFSDGHPIWKLVDEETRKDLEVKYEADGEFWIPFDQVFAAFSFVEICYVK